MVIIKSDQAMDQWETFGIDDLKAVSSTRNTLVLNKETSLLFGTPEKPFDRVRTSLVSVSALIFCWMSRKGMSMMKALSSRNILIPLKKECNCVKILIVDDNEYNIYSLKLLLE